MAQTITRLVPSCEMVRMVNSGTEATLSAIRLARGATGRNRIVKFEGCYHGHGDSFLVKAGSGALTFGVPTSPGVPKALADLTLTLTYNDGIAFGLASGAGPLVIVLALIALVALGWFVASAPPGWPTAIAGGLILGGALGNLFDRVARGEVVDFVSIPAWPAFNLADVAITLGVLALAVIVIRSGAD